MNEDNICRATLAGKQLKKPHSSEFGLSVFDLVFVNYLCYF